MADRRSYHIPRRVALAVEFRVLPFRRFVKDALLWWWINFWLSAIDPLTAMHRIPGLEGCRAYFEFRDQYEYPAIYRFYSLRWLKWRNAAYPEMRRATA